jgi:hypothetical protein
MDLKKFSASGKNGLPEVRSWQYNPDLNHA